MKRDGEFMTEKARREYEAAGLLYPAPPEVNPYRGRLYYEGSGRAICENLARVFSNADDLEVMVEFRTGPRE